MLEALAVVVLLPVPAPVPMLLLTFGLLVLLVPTLPEVVLLATLLAAPPVTGCPCMALAG